MTDIHERLEATKARIAEYVRRNPPAHIEVRHLRAVNAKLLAALAAELTDVEAEAALTSEGTYVWGPDGERFERMFKVVMQSRIAALEGDE